MYIDLALKQIENELSSLPKIKFISKNELDMDNLDTYVLEIRFENDVKKIEDMPEAITFLIKIIRIQQETINNIRHITE